MCFLLKALDSVSSRHSGKIVFWECEGEGVACVQQCHIPHVNLQNTGEIYKDS